MNLAETEPHAPVRPRKTANRETTMPRGDTAQPEAEVNARIRRPADPTSNAEALGRLLGVLSDAEQRAIGQDQERRDERDDADAALDFSEGKQNAERFAKSIAYRNAWQREGAKRLALTISAETTEAVKDRLNDSDNPATLEDIDGVIEGTFRKHVTDGQGNLLDFGTPEAKVILANSLQEVRAGLIPQAEAAIRAQTDTRFLTTWATNSVHEARRGLAIGAPDPLAPLPEGGAPPVSDVGASTGQPSNSPEGHFNVDAALAQVPPSISKDSAKQFLLVSLFNEATKEGDIGLLSGLEDSRRADGSLIFTPEEAESILKARNHIAEHAAKVAALAHSELWQRNGDALLNSMLSGKPPSDDFIAKAASDGQIDPGTAYTLIEHNRAAREEVAREAKAEEREAEADANASYDALVAGEAARLSVGDFTGPRPDELFKADKHGPPGRKALGRYRQLQAAARQGEQRNRDNPLYGQYLGQLRMEYGATQSTFLAPGLAPVKPTVNFYAMTAFYKSRVSKGMEPEEAYLATIDRFGPPEDAAAARQRLIAELRAKKAAGSR
jgi:hypothetical protein